MTTLMRARRLANSFSLPRIRLTRRQVHLTRSLNSDLNSDLKLDTPQVESAQRPTKQPPLIYPEPASQEHHDIASFRSYAARVALNPASTVFVGTLYEYTTAAALSPLGFHLLRVGRAGDRGVDLLGTWTVPSAPQPLRVLVQCKAVAVRATPSWVRELEGAFAGAHAGWRGKGVLGVLVTDKPATPGIRKAMTSSAWPMAYVCCGRDGVVQQILWNHRAEESGLTGMGVVKRHAVTTQDTALQEVVLTWQGEQVLHHKDHEERGEPCNSTTI